MGQSGEYPFSSNRGRAFKNSPSRLPTRREESVSLAELMAGSLRREWAPQHKGIDATTRLPIVISPMTDRHETSGIVERERRAVVHRYFKNDAFGTTEAPLVA
jgi:hypothetical protein